MHYLTESKGYPKRKEYIRISLFFSLSVCKCISDAKNNLYIYTEKIMFVFALMHRDVRLVLDSSEMTIFMNPQTFFFSFYSHCCCPSGTLLSKYTFFLIYCTSEHIGYPSRHKK